MSGAKLFMAVYQESFDFSRPGTSCFSQEISIGCEKKPNSEMKTKIAIQ